MYVRMTMFDAWYFINHEIKVPYAWNSRVLKSVLLEFILWRRLWTVHTPSCAWSMVIWAVCFMNSKLRGHWNTQQDICHTFKRIVNVVLAPYVLFTDYRHSISDEVNITSAVWTSGVLVAKLANRFIGRRHDRISRHHDRVDKHRNRIGRHHDRIGRHHDRVGRHHDRVGRRYVRIGRRYVRAVSLIP